MKSSLKAWGKETMFCVNKIDRKMDKVGGGGDRSFYHPIPFNQVLAIVKFDTNKNDFS